MVLLKLFLSFFLFCASAQSQNHIKDFKIKSIQVGFVKLKVAIADTEEKRKQGLMFVKDWTKYQGMLFIFEHDAPQSFWMKNTLLPLSIGFFNAAGKLQQVSQMNPPLSIAQTKLDRTISDQNAKYALEVPQGWFKKHKVSLGAGLQLEKK